METAISRCFSIVEAQFYLRKIARNTTKFDTVISSRIVKYADELMPLVQNASVFVPE